MKNLLIPISQNEFQNFLPSEYSVVSFEPWLKFTSQIFSYKMSSDQGIIFPNFFMNFNLMRNGKTVKT